MERSGARVAFHSLPGSLCPARPEPSIEQALRWWRQGDVEQAEELLHDTVRRHPREATAAVLLARLLVQRDAVAQAAQVIATAVRHCAGHPLLLLAEGEVLLHRREFAQARERFQ